MTCKSTSTRTPDLFTGCAESTPRVSAAERRWAPVYRIELVREREISLPVVSAPEDVAPIACDYLKRADREHFAIIMLATNNEIIGINTVHIGSLSASIVSACEVFKPAVLANAASVICLHNHPFGNPEPSREDIRVSRRLVDAGKLLEIRVLDSLVVTRSGKYTSLAERGLLNA